MEIGGKSAEILKMAHSNISRLNDVRKMSHIIIFDHKRFLKHLLKKMKSNFILTSCKSILGSAVYVYLILNVWYEEKIGEEKNIKKVIIKKL